MCSRSLYSILYCYHCARSPSRKLSQARVERRHALDSCAVRKLITFKDRFRNTVCFVLSYHRRCISWSEPVVAFFLSNLLTFVVFTSTKGDEDSGFLLSPCCSSCCFALFPFRYNNGFQTQSILKFVREAAKVYLYMIVSTALV